MDASQPKALLLFTPSKDSSTTHLANLNYTYSVGGSTYSGVYKREFPTEWEAWEFLRDLEGKPITVTFDPKEPSTSIVNESAIESLLQTRGPAPPDELARRALAEVVPPWLTPFVWILIFICDIGFILSFWAHVGAVMARQVIPEIFFWILHVGIFVVWFPAVLIAKRRVGNLERRDFWKVILKGVPNWIRYCVYGVFCFGVIDGFISVYKIWPDATGPISPINQWRFFSDIWMAFYAAAFAILFSAATVEGGGGCCVNGHPVSLGAKYCNRCGQPVARLE